MRYFLLLFLSLSASAGIPVDVVFDIDLTIVASVQGGDLLADPLHPQQGTVDIFYANQSERYRVFPGMRELMEKLQRDPRIRVSFFSGGTEARNEALLKKILLSDGTSLWDLSQGRVLGRSSLTPTGEGPDKRIRDRFKKDLTKINSDLSDVIIIDDIKEFIPENQKAHLIWTGEEFPFPERTAELPSTVHPDVLLREKNKYQWISRMLDEALKKRFSTGRPLSETIRETSLRGSGCHPVAIIDRLLLE
jgi:hypothetical protein